MKKLLIEIILRLKVTMNQLKTKNTFLGFFLRFVRSALALRPRTTFICAFGTLFGFFNFPAFSSGS